MLADNMNNNSSKEFGINIRELKSDEQLSQASDTLRSPGLLSPLKARLNPDGSEKKKKKLSVKENKKEKIKIANFLALKEPQEPV